MKRFYAEDSTLHLSKEIAKELSNFYYYHLTSEIMPHWKKLSLDVINGGYETNFDENWNIVASTKNIWAQTRDLIMFSLMYQHVEKSEQWLTLIQSGRDFLVTHFYAGNGLWNYRVSNDGKELLEGPISLLSDLFAMEALAQYVLVTGDRQDLKLIKETYEAAIIHLKDPNYKNIMPHIWEPNLERHSHYMLMVNTLSIVEQVLGDEKVHPILMECIDKILYFFSGIKQDDYLLEYRALNGNMVNSDSGHLINPGHIFESMWFCLQICLAENDTIRISRILDITNHTFDMSIDRQYGGIFHLLDCTGKAAAVIANTRNRQLNWNDKVDWVNCEALYLFALIATVTNDPKDFQRFIRQHNFCQKYFNDPEHGDWFTTLTFDRVPIANQKGTKHRCAFHLPRAILDTYLVFDAIAIH